MFYCSLAGNRWKCPVFPSQPDSIFTYVDLISSRMNLMYDMAKQIMLSNIVAITCGQALDKL
jgi:hypothetical protein